MTFPTWCTFTCSATQVILFILLTRFNFCEISPMSSNNLIFFIILEFNFRHLWQLLNVISGSLLYSNSQWSTTFLLLMFVLQQKWKVLSFCGRCSAWGTISTAFIYFYLRLCPFFIEFLFPFLYFLFFRCWAQLFYYCIRPEASLFIFLFD